METRPKLEIALSQSDKMIEVLAFAILALAWLLLVWQYKKLPDRIPMHFNIKGAVDGFGDKAMIWLLPGVTTALYLLLTFINRFPEQFNYLVRITESNAAKQYTLATKLMRTLKLSLVLVFFLLEYLTIQAAWQQGQGLSVWFLPITLGLVLLPLLYYFLSQRN